MNYLVVLLLLVTAASLMAVSRGNKNMTSDWSYGGFNYSSHWPSYHHNRTRTPTTFLVGGSQGWRFGINYSDWAFQNAPFYLNDILVFKYDPPINGSHPHSVYLLPDLWSYLTCDFRRAKRVATPTQGADRGFKFVLKRWQPHYFACGESNGFHCSNGNMKLFVLPIFRLWSR